LNDKNVTGVTSRYLILVPVLKVMSMVLDLEEYSTSAINLEAGENFSDFPNLVESVAIIAMRGL